MGCFALLFYLLAIVYYKDSVDVLFAGIALLAVFKAIESLPYYFHIKNVNRPRQKALLRITQFIRSNDAFIPEDDEIDENLTVPQNWPKSGNIRIENAWLRYNEDANPALKGLNVVIEAGTKAIVVGRTGAGKSSFLSAIVRLVKLEYGKIIVD